jgi:RNA polymerase sigma-70 factor (ECF subfamily)
MSAVLPYPCPVPWKRWGRDAALAVEGDAPLLDRLRAQESQAFEALVQAHERELYQLAHRLLRDREEAMDATQEAFLRAFRALPRFRGEASLRTWLYGITLNVCRNHLGAAARRHHQREEPLTWHDDEGGERARPLGDPAPSPEQEAWAGELRLALERALSALPPDHREVVVLREVQGLDYEEMAAVLGCALGTVRSRLARARAALRQALEGVWP